MKCNEKVTQIPFESNVIVKITLCHKVICNVKITIFQKVIVTVTITVIPWLT